MITKNSIKQKIHVNKKYKNNSINIIFFSPISQIKNNLYNIGSVKLGVSSDFILSVVILLSIAVGIIGYILLNNIFFAIIIFIGCFKLIKYIFNKTKKKKIKNLYNQIEKFISLCEKDNYNNITDYFGQIYTQFNGELRDNLEKCFIEQKTIGKEKALQHFLEKYNDEYFSFCITTLDTIKSNNKIRNTEEMDYFRKQTKNKSILKQYYHHQFLTNKIDIFISFLGCLICMIICKIFFGFSFKVLYNSLGLILICLYFILLLFGLLKTE